MPAGSSEGSTAEGPRAGEAAPAAPSAAPPAGRPSGRARGALALRGILAFAIVSTALHFTHNFVEIDRYPASDSISDGAVRAAIVVSWPLFTVLALYGYRLYRRGRYDAAHACLAAYSPFCLATLGHFLQGSPDIPAFWYATIFTDGAAGVAVAGFALWSVALSRRGSRLGGATGTR